MLEDLKAWTRWLAVWALVMYWMVVLIGKFPIQRDDTDPGQWGERSGLVLRTDSLTGCQYISGGGSGITPRLTADGKHMGCSK